MATQAQKDAAAKKAAEDQTAKDAAAKKAAEDQTAKDAVEEPEPEASEFAIVNSGSQVLSIIVAGSTVEVDEFSKSEPITLTEEQAMKLVKSLKRFPATSLVSAKELKNTEEKEK